jgi:ABC-type transport system involved in multi-copper enzyme maturation permease subunit
MKSQILHIFKNDVRHFWREIVLILAIVTAYGWQTSSHLREPEGSSPGIGFSFLSQILSLLVPVSFIFLILRAVHAECPVGDRQFWVTRPYDWRKLLAAKVLLVFTFVNLSLFILQVFLLWQAGFWPPKYFLGLLGLQVLWIAFVFLPAATLAVVTASIG